MTAGLQYQAPNKRATSPLRPNEHVSGRKPWMLQVSSMIVARSFEAAGMPAGLQVERPAQPGGPGFVSRFRANGIAQQMSCTRLSRCFLNFMANAGGNTLETSGFKFRPMGREAR